MIATKFLQWFTTKLVVGPYPGLQTPGWHPKDFIYVINVSGEYYAWEIVIYQSLQYFWFPMSEQKKDMGLNSIFGALTILSQAEEENAAVYLHCHSGSNRSRTVRCAYYYMRTGSHLVDPHKSGPHLNKLLANCDRHYLPAQAEMEAWLRAVGKGLSTGITSELLTVSKLETINNF